MPREIPDVPQGWKLPQPGSSHSFEIELITPMVGGGATAGKVDPDFPIRPTAIRGHLRHWWRMVRGHSLGDGMWRREEEIFGSTEFPSPVTVRVSPGPKKPLLFPSTQITSLTHKYILFPVIENEHAILQEGYQFHLSLSILAPNELKKRRQAQNRGRKSTDQLRDDIPAIEADVLAALKAWVHFGGVGARTRRGCGAIRVIKESEPPQMTSQPDLLMKSTLREMPSEVQIFQTQSPVPHLEAWERVIGLLKAFRQPPPARRGEPRRTFPEAETLRRITGVRGRRNRQILEGNMPNGFPRAELGLPIVFKFKDGSDPVGQTALPHGNDSTGKPLQRMGSPVILKPIPVSPTNSLPTIIVLHRPKNLTVDVASAADQPVTGSQFAQYSKSPLAGTSGSAIEAFINFSDFMEVTR